MLSSYQIFIDERTRYTLKSVIGFQPNPNETKRNETKTIRRKKWKKNNKAKGKGKEKGKKEKKRIGKKCRCKSVKTFDSIHLFTRTHYE